MPGKTCSLPGLGIGPVALISALSVLLLRYLKNTSVEVIISDQGWVVDISSFQYLTQIFKPMKSFQSLATLCLVAWCATLFSNCQQAADRDGRKRAKTTEEMLEANAPVPVNARVSVGEIVSFKGSNGLYVCGENGTQAMRCNRTTASDWEKFTVVDAGGGKVALRSMGKY